MHIFIRLKKRYCNIQISEGSTRPPRFSKVRGSRHLRPPAVGDASACCELFYTSYVYLESVVRQSSRSDTRNAVGDE